MSDAAEDAPQRLPRGDGGWVAYRRSPGRAPTVAFLCGYASDMSGTKAAYLARRCRDAGRAYLRLDYRGHGASSGRFEDGTLGEWAGDAIAVLEAATEGPLVLVGSSMGGWIMLLAARALGERVRGLVGVAAAPDFVARAEAALTAEEAAALARDGVCYRASRYGDPLPLTRRFLDEAREHLVLERPPVVAGPVRLLHGLADPDVPWRASVELCERLDCADARVTLVGGAGHRMSEPRDLELLWEAVDEVARLAEAGGA